MFYGVAAVTLLPRKNWLNKRVMNNSWYIPIFPEQASTFAWQVDALYLYLVAITLFFTFLVFGVIIVFFVKYRERVKYATPEQIEGSTALEAIWSVIPFVISITIFVGGAVVYYNQYRMPEEGMEVYIVGKQWMWKMQHATGQREINELHVPVGRKVKLTMTTEDVLHDFSIPAFRTKGDVVPGRYTYLWFEATQTGKFRIFCTEYCGLNHSGMGGYVYVMEQRDYDNWLAGNTANQTPAEAGKDLFVNKLGCASCHGAEGKGGRGASLAGVFGKPHKMASGQTVVADEAYIRESILNPQAQIVEGYQPIMPTFKGQVSEEQLVQLVAYIKSLGGATNTTTTNAAPTGGKTTPAQTGTNFDSAGRDGTSQSGSTGMGNR